MTIRPFRDQDRGPVLALLGGDPRTLDSPSNRIHVAQEGGVVVGAVVWTQPDAGEEAQLGIVTVSLPGRRHLFYQLVRACAVDALARGFQRARFDVLDRALLALLERDFTITAQPLGWNPQTHEPVEWRVAVDLADALKQLAKVGV